MTIELSRHGSCIEADSFGVVTVSSGAFAARSEVGAIIRLGRANAAYGSVGRDRARL